MTNIIGDEGMGYYSTAFNVYNIMLILSSYSLPLAVSKMVAARLAKGQYRNMNRVLRAALVYATVVGGLACFITWNFAGFLQRPCLTRRSACMHSAHLRQRSGSWRIWACCAVISRDMERCFRRRSPDPGAGGQRDHQCGGRQRPFQGGTGYSESIWKRWICTGIWRGRRYDRQEAARLQPCYLCWYCFYSTVRRQNGGLPDRSGSVDSYRQISRIFFFTVIPVIVSSGVYNINSVIDNGIMAHGMESLGRGKEFLALWGIYNNKYMLLVHVRLRWRTHCPRR